MSRTWSPPRSSCHASRVDEQGAFIFLALFVALALPSLEEQWQWLEDECYIVAQDSSCIGGNKGRCYVLVALSSSPICSSEVCIKRQHNVYYNASDDHHEAERCA